MERGHPARTEARRSLAENEVTDYGKAKPFRTSGGKAANAIV
jgi:hypothetical protein